MSDEHEQDTWEQDEVEIVDLGAPDRGLSRYIFRLGEKWQAVAPFRGRFVALVIALCLLMTALQSGSTGANNQVPGAPHAVPTRTHSSTIYIIDCISTISVSSYPDQASNLQQWTSTPTTQKCSFSVQPDSLCTMQQQLTPPPSSQGAAWVCNVGTPSPVPAGKNGKSR